jgi:hypothetical protein
VPWTCGGLLEAGSEGLLSFMCVVHFMRSLASERLLLQVYVQRFQSFSCAFSMFNNLGSALLCLLACVGYFASGSDTTVCN